MAIVINRIEDYSAIFEICKNKDVNLKNIELETTPMSPSFFNSSFGELIDNYGYKKFKEIVVVADITKSHFELILKYISWHKEMVVA